MLYSSRNKLLDELFPQISPGHLFSIPSWHLHRLWSTRSVGDGRCHLHHPLRRTWTLVVNQNADACLGKSACHTCLARGRSVMLKYFHLLKMHHLLASFCNFPPWKRTESVRGGQSFPSFLALKQSLHCPINLPVHSLFIAKDAVHVSFG